jgi:hypothetical protein
MRLARYVFNRCVIYKPPTPLIVLSSGSQPLSDRGPLNPFFFFSIRRGPGTGPR